MFLSGIYEILKIFKNKLTVKIYRFLKNLFLIIKYKKNKLNFSFSCYVSITKIFNNIKIGKKTTIIKFNIK